MRLYEEVKTTVDQAQADFDAKLGEYNTAKAAETGGLKGI